MAKGMLRTNRNYAKENTINIDISSEMIIFMLNYSLDVHSEYISIKNLTNMEKLLNIIDTSKYETERYDDYTYIQSIKFILKLRIKKNIKNFDILAQNIFDGLKDYPEIIDYVKDYLEEYRDCIDNDEEFIIIEDENVKYVNIYVSERLTYYNIFKARDLLNPIFKKIDSNNVNLEKLSDDYTENIEKIFSENMKVKKEIDEKIDDFQLLDKTNREKIINKAIDEYNKPNNKIKTGIKCLNQMLNGGFENGRFYLICGLPKSFKSGFLLNCAIWGIKYNKEFALKNPNKKPAIFYLTQENSTRETINRLYVSLTGKSIKDLNKREANELLSIELGKYGVDLFIRYRATKTISTLDFDNMISEIETENNVEVVMAIQDYTKRIKSSNPNPELRFELGIISDDFCAIAKRRNIPILSGAQMNRSAFSAAENAASKNRKDISKDINASQIGESVDLLQNADVSMLIYKEVLSETNNSFLGVRLLLTRDEESDVTYFAQKFENGMRLEEDFDLAESLSYQSIGSSMVDDFDPDEARKKTNKRKPRKNNNEENGTFRKTKRKTINSNKTENEVDLDDDEDIEFDGE